MENLVLLQAAAQGGNSMVSTFIMMGAVFLVMYFFMIRPQQKKQKAQKAFTEGIKKGDQVVTIGGIYGKIVEINDTKVILDVDRGTKITFEKSAISMENSKSLSEEKK
ncbi:preprotein translocase subunit YajC [Aureibacter tunicatorum]|uniref:Sec translocon accessory complex subunit YajC n=1 Tax=Aureibacter tunicatorum TaxID=866807 RepID=A0AAE4BRG2_9BACT|nr:preprotein translocase subunit YajC [Aureibacter tunicatorum]MDR6238631.1 preprotein translocase subunit YajC [Aureibacter tunicatorum]BDD05438.1 preprotein translocase subunit YajC [Aureibacter tunicatorum]